MLCRRRLQSDSLPAVEERLRKLGVPFLKTQVVEGGIRVTQVQLPSTCPVTVKKTPYGACFGQSTPAWFIDSLGLA